jgi:predicted Rossmann fold flavoprotein
VLNALLDEARRRGVELRTGQRVVGIRRGAPGDPSTESLFQLTVSSDGHVRQFHSRNIVLATGGRSLPRSGSDGAGYELARQLGHTIVTTTPALDPLCLAGAFHVPLAGISMPVELTIHSSGSKPIRISGPLLWTHFGISGPAVLDASRHWHRARIVSTEPVTAAGSQDDARVRITANFLPGLDFAAIESRVLELAAAQPRTQLHNALPLLAAATPASGSSPALPARFVAALLSHLAIPGQVPLAQFDRAQRRRLVHALHAFELPIRGSRGYNYAEATAGGVPLSEIDPGDMGSRRCSGLHLVGEILDVDGRIGGFNFQWAWASGFVCGQRLGRIIHEGIDDGGIRGV